jgi:hypothetical protein
MIKYRTSLIFILVPIALLTVSCKTLSQYDSTEIFTRRQPEISVKIKSIPSVGERVHISSPLIAGGRLEGFIRDTTSDSMPIVVDTLFFLANWPGGWTEGRINAYAELTLDPTDDGYVVTVNEELSLWQVKTGSIKYYENIISGDRGRELLQNRYDRIEAVLDFLDETDLPDYFGHPGVVKRFGPPLKPVIGPMLFPEMYIFNSAEKRGRMHPNWYMPDPVDDGTATGDFNMFDVTNDSAMYDLTTDMTDVTGDLETLRKKIRFGSDIPWKTAYTDKVFPDQLREVRDSGSMWRDFEESSDLHFILYNLDYFMEKLSRNSYFRIEK